jgi:pimeloyl-ACP methyl ester carboxylesterase
VRVVLLHGLTNSSRAFGRLIPLLDGLDVTAIDLPGHSSKADQPGKRSIEEIADSVIPEMPEPGVVLGHSIGGYSATAIAERRPDLVTRLIVVNSAPVVANRRLAGHGGEKALRTPVLGPLLWRAMTRRKVRDGIATAFAPDAYITEKSLYNRVQSISAPTTIVFGEQDQRIDPASVDGYAATKASVVRVRAAGHTPTWETPEALAAVVRAGDS